MTISHLLKTTKIYLETDVYPPANEIDFYPNSNLDIEQKYQLRAWAIDLAIRCAHAAVTASSGGANLSHHHAQRVDREALVFTVYGQTKGLMAATLNRLSRQSLL